MKPSGVRRLTPCFVGAAACLLYLATLSNHHTGDSIGYALAIARADLALLLDPYHPVLHPVGLLFYRLWQLAGWTGRALLPLQVPTRWLGASAPICSRVSPACCLGRQLVPQ
jgi:hypothetical protein